MLLYYFLYDFGEGGDDGNGTVVGCFGSAAGFVDGMNNGVFPGCGKITGCKTRVENEEKDVTDGTKTKFEDPDANTVRARGRGIFHPEENGVKRLEGDWTQGEGTCTHSG